MKLILLPGLDGTGNLFKALLEVLPNHITYQVIPLSDECLNYSEQASQIANQIDTDEIIILAESYSGKIVYELCKLDLNIKHIIFAASFISRPSLISKFSSLLPIILIKKKFIPNQILSKLFFDSYNMSNSVSEVFESLNKVSNETLSSRLSLVSSLDEPNDRFAVKATYIRPSNDLFVMPECIKPIKSTFQHLEVINVSGGHFILQSNPERCSEIIQTKFEGW
ncbi:hypothetical protein RI845_03025 [Thalassotalea nanhaiensis]|uniref:Alpha/beta hydrolase n=1 Tax=Thalassotalea nanhaiensis TaxID=3065648 RepID=A0ABY9TK05_9GAMM|nr:hypothetical protein RI845_03025 [Colwelliaceae bacterium SQ345]